MSTRTHVLDTSVLLSDPWAPSRFDEHAVVVPAAVVAALAAMREDLEQGGFAAAALDTLDGLRAAHGRLDRPVPVGDAGGTVVVDTAADGTGEGGDPVLRCAQRLRDAGAEVIVVSRDAGRRVLAAGLGLSAQEYHAQEVVDTGWTGMATVSADEAEVRALAAGQETTVAAATALPWHTGLELPGPDGTVLGRVRGEGLVRPVPGEISAFGLTARSAEQQIALDILLDPEVGIVSLGGRAGTGKSALALCAGLESVLERGDHRRVVIFRPMYAVGGQELGFLPGSEGEKMNPWAQAVFDTLEGLAEPHTVQEIVDRELLEVLPLTHIRGRSLHESFVIVDEAQSLERNVLLTVLSRMGAGSRVVLTHDVDQRDNLLVGRHDGVAAVVDKLTGEPLFAHVTLTRSERSAIAELVTERLADFAPGS